MNIVQGLDISDIKPNEFRRLKVPLLQLNNRWSTYLYVMPDNSLMITINQSTKIPMKLTKLIVELNEKNIKTYENLEFITYKPLGISLPSVDYIETLKFYMETDAKDYKSVGLTKDEIDHYSENLKYIHCLDSKQILNVCEFKYCKRVTNHEERRLQGMKKLIAEGYKPKSKKYKALCL